MSSSSRVNEATVETGLGRGSLNTCKRGVEVVVGLLNKGDVYSWRRTGGSTASVITEFGNVYRNPTKNEVK